MDDNLHTAAVTLAQSLANVPDDQLPFLDQLCSISEQQWRSQLRSDVNPSDCQDSFLCAAALSAIADWHASQNSGVSSFSVGSVSVSGLSAAESAARDNSLRALARRIMAPWCLPDDFDFRGVRT